METYKPRVTAFGITPYNTQGDKSVYILRDEEEEHFILTEQPGITLLKLLDGSHTVEGLHRDLERQFEMNIPTEQIQSFLDLCGQNNLLVKDSWRVTAPQRGRGIWKTLGFHRILIRTEPLSRWLHHHRWLWFNPLTIVAALVLMIAGLIGIFSPLTTSVSMSSLMQFVVSFQLPMLFPVLMLLEIALHELGHTLACAYYNARSRGWGFGLLWGVMPIFFTDTSGAYTLKSKFQRVMISLAGPMVDLAILGVCALVVLLTPGDAPIHHFAQVYSIVPFSMLLVNLNPFLLRLDGYWIVVDLLGKPNLRTSAVRYIKTKLLQLIGRASAQDIRIVDMQLARNRHLHWIYIGYFTVASLWTINFMVRVITLLISTGSGFTVR